MKLRFDDTIIDVDARATAAFYAARHTPDDDALARRARLTDANITAGQRALLSELGITRYEGIAGGASDIGREVYYPVICKSVRRTYRSGCPLRRDLHFVRRCGLTFSLHSPLAIYETPEFEQLLSHGAKVKLLTFWPDAAWADDAPEVEPYAGHRPADAARAEYEAGVRAGLDALLSIMELPHTPVDADEWLATKRACVAAIMRPDARAGCADVCDDDGLWCLLDDEHCAALDEGDAAECAYAGATARGYTLAYEFGCRVAFHVPAARLPELRRFARFFGDVYIVPDGADWLLARDHEGCGPYFARRAGV